MDLDDQIRVVNKLPEVIKESLIDYTKDIYYESINKALRKGQKIRDDREKQIVVDIMIAFELIPPIERPITVYRGIGEEPIALNKAFMSTSRSIGRAKQFTGMDCCLLKILVPPGSKIIPLWSISSHGYEQEILLPLGGSLVVTKVIEEKPMKTYDVVYIPPESVVIGENVSTANDLAEETAKLEEDLRIESLKSRIINLVNPDEIEILGVNETVDNIIDSGYFIDELIPLKVREDVKLYLKSIYGQ